MRIDSKSIELKNEKDRLAEGSIDLRVKGVSNLIEDENQPYRDLLIVRKAEKKCKAAKKS